MTQASRAAAVLLLLHLLFPCLPGQAQPSLGSQQQEEEVRKLRQLLSSLVAPNGTRWGWQPEWLELMGPSDPELYSWHAKACEGDFERVECRGDNITYLDLSDMGLDGVLTSGTWKLLPPLLQHLNISHNLLRGSIPPHDNLPLSMATLDLSHNQLGGECPTDKREGAKEELVVYIKPGNDGLCGEVPTGEPYYNDTYTKERVSLGKSCPWQTSSGVSPEVVAAAVVGAVAGTVLVGLLCWWCIRRRRRRQRQEPEAKSEEAMDAMEKAHPGSAHPVKPLQDSAHLELPPWRAADVGARIGAAHPGISAKPAGLLARDPLLASIVAKLAAGHRCGSAGELGAPPSPGLLPTPTPSSLNSTATRGRSSLPDVRLWLIPFESLELEEEVYLARWNETHVAVKLLLDVSAAATGNVDAAAAQILSLSNPVLRTLEQEASTIAALRHPNVLAFMGLCTSPPCLVSEYCPRGSLYDVLQEARDAPEAGRRMLSWPRRVSMMLDTALGMNYLHSRSPPLIHRDLKSPNLLIDANWRVKVADFNLSKIMEEVSVASSTAAVTNPRWLAPEVLAGHSPTFASDVFSFAVVLWEVLTWQLPWEWLTNPWQVVGGVMEGKRLPVPPEAEQQHGSFPGLGDYLDLMRSCWAQDPLQRPSFAQIIPVLRDLLAQAGKGSASSSRRSLAPAASSAAVTGESSGARHDVAAPLDSSEAGLEGTPRPSRRGRDGEGNGTAFGSVTPATPAGSDGGEGGRGWTGPPPPSPFDLPA